MKSNKYRTHSCGELSLSNIDERVTLSGWVETIRDHGGVLFLDLRDMYGVTQLVSNDDAMFAHIPKESVIKVAGTVRKRDEETINKHIATGEVEVLVDSLEVLSKSKGELPFEIKNSLSVSEDLRLKYRYLDLRNKEMLENIVLRTKVIDYMRTKMKDLGFLEVQTPILTASSPEGAREFIVPARKHQGKFYVLPQAPQIFKQLLMVGGIDKYFQIAPCFRDEDARSDRLYGEFYQLDFEMSFVTEEDVYEVGEEILYEVFKKFSDKEVSQRPFRRIPYRESILKYGTDKPDLRNPLIIEDITSILANTQFKPFQRSTIRAIKCEGIASNPNSWFNEIVDFASSIGMPGIGYLSLLGDNTFKGPIDKFLTEEERSNLISSLDMKANDVVFFIANRKESQAAKFAGEIRSELGRKLGLIDEKRFELCIVNDMPFYEYDEEARKYEFGHNPFSMPQGGLEALDKDPKDILAYQYDFVCNGVEISSGAVRNHDIEIMKKAFSIAGYDEVVVKSKFPALYKAFEFGAPPHAGMAPGIDRILMLLKDEDKIRNLVAFPMNAQGEDLLMGSPNDVDEKQLREAHIKLR